MRIVSLLPSATEIVYALGLGGALVGVTDECDFPPEARDVPAVSHARLATSPGADRDGQEEPGADASPVLAPGEVDRAVSESLDRGEPLYRLDADRIRALQPDVILAQDLCRVCAVPSGMVEEALDRIGCRAAVLSLDPATLDEVLEGLVEVGRVAGVEERAAAVAAALRGRLAAVRAATAGRERPRVLALEWSDPPFVGGHWVPDMVAAAGGDQVLGSPGGPSRRLGWDEVGASGVDTVVFMPCGYHLDQAVAEGRALAARPELAGAGAIWAVDASSSFSRPGPRLVDGVEALAAALHPGSVADPPPGLLARVR